MPHISNQTSFQLQLKRSLLLWSLITPQLSMNVYELVILIASVGVGHPMFYFFLWNNCLDIQIE